MEKKKNSSLPMLKLTDDLKDELQKVVDLLNVNLDGLKISLPEVRRLAYSRLINDVLNGDYRLGFLKGKI